MMRLLTLTLVVVAVAIAATSAVAQSDAACTGAQLKGTFNAIRGSAGAGNITYKLVLKNVSTHMCTLTGLPQGRLLGRTGKALPTHVRAASPGMLTAILVRRERRPSRRRASRPTCPARASRPRARSASRPHGGSG